MSKFTGIRLFSFILILLAGFGCANEIKLFPDEVPSEYMVFGIMDANSPNQYIKIRKTFGGNTGLEQMAANPDLFLPPDSIEVRLEEWTDDGIVFHPLKRIVLEKDVGLFAEHNNVVYHGLLELEEGSHV